MISLKKITKKFGNHLIFSELNLEIQEGELVAIMGDSGAGKSTLLNIIGLLDVEYDGHYLISGQNLKNASWRKKSEFIRSNINYLFQNYALVDDETVMNNLMYALYYSDFSKDEKNEIIRSAMNEVKLINVLDKEVYKLSGGEQQRVSLARLIIKKGNLVLADEPTGNLDTKNKEIVVNILKKLNEMGKTVVIVTHDEYVASNCTRVITL